jgi:hypothetical protein
MSSYLFRALVIADIATATTLNEMLNPIHGPENLGARFHAEDADPADAPTHLGCDAPFTADAVAEYQSQFGAMVNFCKVQNGTHELLETNAAEMVPFIGQAVTLGMFAAELGLKRRRECSAMPV